MQKKYLLFDLDGTLTDSKLGITRCVQYALKSLGIDEPDLDKLECYIGPPLIDSFQRYHGLSLEQAQIGVAKYRERFRDTGIFENEVIAGIPEVLEEWRWQHLSRKNLHCVSQSIFIWHSILRLKWAVA